MFGLVLATLLVAACGEEPHPGVEVRLPASPPGAVLIQDVAVLDVRSGERTLGRDVLLRDGRIASIEPTGATAPAGAQIIAGRGATLVPGLIDMHGHVNANSAPSWLRGTPDPEANLRAYLYSGITTVFDPADMSEDAFARRERVAKGELIGPRIFTTGPILTCPNGHPQALIAELAPWWIAWYLMPRVGTAIESEQEARATVDTIAANKPDAIKIVIDAIPLEAPRLRREIARAVVEQARSHGVRTVAHIGTTQDAIDAAEAGVALWVHGVYKEPIPEDQIAVLAGYGIPMVATIEVFDSYARASAGPRVPTKLERESVDRALMASFFPVPEDFDVGSLRAWLDLAQTTMQVRVDNVRKLHRAGVTILAGSDVQSGVFPGPSLHRELAHLVRAGMTPAEVIRAATLHPARFLADASEPDFGEVAVGKRADLLLVDGDPTRDIGVLEEIREVFLAGIPLARRAIDVGS